ncbi:PR domain zinc finger protein 4-like [Anthonomus grandis grandis]|uniref:PR domain zinc finger protein 4-like n=1 Tax=Anthonomus grandis grandis TaxID=2921223 RepID=UPI002165DCC5|nr:PR domain zinc finger protein 4-like [Anthonomus grandis grandis]
MSSAQICRLCLIKQEPTNCQRIYEETYNSVNIFDMIQCCLPQMSLIKRSLESIICLQCLDKLYQCYNFISTCYQNDADFKVNNPQHSMDCSSNAGEPENVDNKEELPSVNNLKKGNKFKIYRNKFKEEDCPGCKNRILNAKYHTKVHSDHFDCFHCRRRFFSYVDLRKHLYNHTLLNKCQICDKKCRDKYSLNLHLQTHTGQKLFKCPVCKKSFVQSYNLHQHMEVHEKNGKNRCHICNKTLSTKYNLKIHMTMHNGETKPRCPVCDKWFYTKSALEKHKVDCAKEDEGNEFIELDFVKIEDVTLMD